MWGKKKSTHCFQACLNMYYAAQVLSPCQTVNHLCDTAEVPQPVSLLWLTDYVCQACQAPDSHGVSVCTPNEVFYSRPAVWMTQSVIHASVKAGNGFPLKQILPTHSAASAEYQNKVSASLDTHCFCSYVPQFLYVPYQVGKSQVWCRYYSYLSEQSQLQYKGWGLERLGQKPWSCVWTDPAAIFFFFFVVYWSWLLVITAAAWEHSAISTFTRTRLSQHSTWLQWSIIMWIHVNDMPSFLLKEDYKRKVIVETTI